jgi:uncharacterized protein (TIGR03663 family)
MVALSFDRKGPSMEEWPGESGITPVVWSLCGIVIISVAVILRLYALDLKPLHHDEGVNGLLMTGLVRPPYSYQYDPANYHGPSLYYLAKPIVSGLGLTTFAIRLVPAVCGIIIVLLAFELRRRIGAMGALIAAALIAVSPGAVYFARYFIHETLLVCFTFATVVASWQYIDRRRPVYLMIAAASLGMMFATKETAVITAGVLTIAAGMTALYPAVMRRIGDARFRKASPSALDASPPALNAASGPTLMRRHRIVGRNLAVAAICAVIFIGVNVVFYSSFFTRWQGLEGAVRSFAIWTQTGTRDHVQPWSTYLRWMLQEEALLLVLGIAGSGVAFWKGRNAFVRFAALWGIGTLLAYSLIPYKTPWLTLNVIVPLAIVSGWTIEAAYIRASAAWRRAIVALAVLSLGFSGYQSWILNFVRYDDDRYAYVYAHTRRGVLDLVNRIAEIRARAPSGITIAVVSPEYFPLSWYLADYRAGYYGRVTKTPDPIFVGSVKQDAALRAQLGHDYVRSGPYPLRPGVDLVLYVRRDLATP